MANKERSNNEDNELNQLYPLCGGLGNKNGENELDRLRCLKERLAPERTLAPSCIWISTHPGTFHFRNGMITTLPQFYGMENEKAYLHLRKFDEVCETFSNQSCPREIAKLKLFPFTLKDKAKSWLLSLRPGSITTWSALHDAFLKLFFPNWLTTDLMRHIKTFSQKKNEKFVQAWERFKDLLLSCPYHGFEKWRTINFFYDGLTPKMKKLIETMLNGEFMDKNQDEAKKHF